MISFEPTPDQKMMKDSVADFARTRLAPKIREVEKARALADQVKRDAFELGLALAPFAERVGGAGLGLMTTVLLEEEIAYGDPAAAFGFGGPGALGFAVTELGTEEQAKELLAHFGKPEAVGAVAWSEASAHKERPGLIARATKNGSTWTIDGEKSFVINASTASHFIVFAQVDESAGWNGTAAFVVENRAPGVSIGERATTLGLDVMSASTVSFKGVQVTESARLAGGADYAAALLRFFLKNGLIVASRCVGLARAAFDVTHAYVQTRKAFGKPIGHFQSVAFTLSDRAMDVDAAQALVWKAATLWDAFAESGKGEAEARLATARAISYAQETAMRTANDALQLHGGAGFIRDYPVEKYMRDAKQLNVTGITKEQADQIAAAVELRAPIDLGFLLPNAETQSVFL